MFFMHTRVMNPRQIARALRITADRLDNSDRPSKKRVASSINGILRHIVGSNWADLKPLEAKDCGTSQLLWHAMKYLGIEDWENETNIDEVIEMMRTLANGINVGNIEPAIQYAIENFNDFHEHYNPMSDPGAPDR